MLPLKRNARHFNRISSLQSLTLSLILDSSESLQSPGFPLHQENVALDLNDRNSFGASSTGVTSSVCDAAASHRGVRVGYT